MGGGSPAARWPADRAGLHPARMTVCGTGRCRVGVVGATALPVGHADPARSPRWGGGMCWCGVCGLGFATIRELTDHLILDHGKVELMGRERVFPALPCRECETKAGRREPGELVATRRMGLCRDCYEELVASKRAAQAAGG